MSTRRGKMTAKAAAAQQSRAVQGNDSEVDRYIVESVKSYKECNIKNNARRNSLQKKTLGIESERRLATANMSREERQLREQLKNMNIEKMKHNLVHNLREQRTKKPKKKTSMEEEHMSIPTEPYPVTFRSHTPSPVDLDARERKLYLIHRGRRQSKEFEDLSISTKSGKLSHPREQSEEDEQPRRRVFSMSHAMKPRFRSDLLRVDGGGSCTSSPRTSPGLRRKVSTPRTSPGLHRKISTQRGGFTCTGKKGNHSSSSSKDSLEDMDKVNSLEDLHWVGEPEAIHSVRRARRTVEEQELNTELHKLRNT